MVKSRMLPIEFPLKGENEAWAHNVQPRGTTPRALNVVPFDPAQGRARGGQRGGLRKWVADNISGGSPISAMLQVTLPGDAVSEILGLRDEVTTENFLYASGPLNFVSGGNWWQVQTSSTIQNATTIAGTPDNAGVVSVDGANDRAVFTPAGELSRSFAAYYNQSSVPSNDLAYRVTVNMDDAPPGSRVALLAHAKTALGPLTNLGMVGVSVRDRRHIAVWSPDGFGESPAYYVDLGAGNELEGEFAMELRVSLSAAEDTTATEYDESKFVAYVNGVKYFEWQSTHTPLASAADQATTDPVVAAEFGSAAGSMYFTTWRIFRLKTSLSKTTRRATRLVIASRGSIYIGDARNGIWETASGVYREDRKPCMTELNGHVYLVDGTNTLDIDVASQTVNPLAAVAGAVPAGCRVCGTYRNRLVLANHKGFEQNVYLSRAGNPKNWLYGQTDAESAVALNSTATAGKIGQPVYAIIPFRDDVMLIGCDHSLYAMTGDPAAGGSIDTVSESIGMFAPEAWTQDPGGTIWFVATGGFYRMEPGGEPQAISADKLPTFFAGIDRAKNHIEVEWDRDAHGCYVFITPATGSAGRHLWYDQRLGSLWPLVFPASMQPISALVYDGDARADRVLLLGGDDGFLRCIDAAAVDDDGQTIQSDLWLGPMIPLDAYSEAMWTALEAVLGADTANLRYSLHAGRDAVEAFAAAPAFEGAWAGGGRQPRLLTRARGNCFFLRLFTTDPGSRWSLERMAALVEYGGPVR